MTLKNNRAPLLCCFKLCASFHSYLWIQNGVTVWKRINWVLTSVSWTFDLWPWPLAWTSLLSIVITPENFMMIQWQEHSEKGVTDRQTDRQTDGQTERGVLRAAWSYLKKGTPYLALMGEVRGTNCEHFGENWPCFTMRIHCSKPPCFCSTPQDNMHCPVSCI